MRTVDNALKILDLFTAGVTEAGLSEIARACGLDKASALRILNSLARHGLLEKHPQTKKYRLGASVLKLARVREASFPFVSIIQPMLTELASLTGETAHASLASGSALVLVGFAEPQRSLRVLMDASQALPFHATASGLAYLSYAPDDVVEAVLKADEFTAYTKHTPTSADTIRAQIAETRKKGFAISERCFEDEVIGIAAPIFDWSGYASGAVAVASVAARVTPRSRRRVASAVIEAAVAVTRATGAEAHPRLLQASKALAA